MPESQIGEWIRWIGLRSALRQRLEERIRAIDRRERTKPHTSEYDRFHLAASLAAAMVSVLNGASIVRVHDVKATADALAVATAVLQSGGQEN